MALRYGSSRGGSSCFSRVFKEFQMKITYYFRFSFFVFLLYKGQENKEVVPTKEAIDC